MPTLKPGEAPEGKISEYLAACTESHLRHRDFCKLSPVLAGQCGEDIVDVDGLPLRHLRQPLLRRPDVERGESSQCRPKLLDVDVDVQPLPVALEVQRVGCKVEAVELEIIRSIHVDSTALEGVEEVEVPRVHEGAEWLNLKVMVVIEPCVEPKLGEVREEVADKLQGDVPTPVTPVAKNESRLDVNSPDLDQPA